jgi:hypothetical protein
MLFQQHQRDGDVVGVKVSRRKKGCADASRGAEVVTNCGDR